MSRNVGGVPFIAPEDDSICMECGQMAETRPYGKGGAEVCFDCGMKNPEIIQHNMNIQLFGESGELV
jgi:hypothetical protein